MTGEPEFEAEVSDAVAVVRLTETAMANPVTADFPKAEGMDFPATAGMDWRAVSLRHAAERDDARLPLA